MRAAAAALIVVLAAAAVASVGAVSPALRRLRPVTPNPAHHTPFAVFEQTGHYLGDDPLSQIRHTLPAGGMTQSASTAPPADAGVLAEVSATARTGAKLRNFCEVCIMAVQMKQRAEPHICNGLNANYYTTCVEILESLLRADKAVVYWLKNGCMHMDSSGPEIVRPCPALPICSWVPNLFASPPSLVRDGVESLCPKDPKFLPTIPNEYNTITNPDQQRAATPGPSQ